MFKLLFVLLLIAIVMIIIVLGLFINDSIKSYQEKIKNKKQVELADKLNTICNDGFEEIKKEVKEMFNNDFVVKKRKDELKRQPIEPNTFTKHLKDDNPFNCEKVENASLYGVPKDNKLCIRVKGFIFRLDVDKAMGTLQRINCFETQIEECEDKIKSITLDFDIKLKSSVECSQDVSKDYIELKNAYISRLIRLKKALSDYEHDVIEEFRKGE